MYSQDLFSDAKNDAAAAAGADKKEKVKRHKLWEQDHVSHQMLNPFGASNFDDLADGDMWKVISEGNKWCKYHSNLACTTEEDGGAARVGIGISQTAEALAVALAQLESPSVKLLLKDQWLEAVKGEAAALKESVEKLNAGKGTLSRGGAGFAGIKRKRGAASAAVPSDVAIRAAAASLYQFLSKPKS